MIWICNVCGLVCDDVNDDDGCMGFVTIVSGFVCLL